MSPRGKQRTTVAKMQRETKTQERKHAKELRKAQRRAEIDRARAEGRDPWPDETQDDDLLLDD